MVDDGGEEDAGLLRMKFEGGRFESHALPVSMLIELARLNRVFVALAEDTWKGANPERQRVPGGFAKRFELCLADVYGGSTIPVMLNREQLATSGMAQRTTLATEAARRLEQAFIEIVRFNKLPENFPKKAERDITTVFSSLEGNEFSSFVGIDGESYNYTQQVRSKFVKSRSEVPQPSTGSIAGRLVGIETEQRTAKLLLTNGSSVAVSFQPLVQDDMAASISVPNDKRFIVLNCNYLIQSGEVTEVTDVSEVYSLDLPINASGRVLRELLSDDISGEVDAIFPDIAEATAELLANSLDAKIPAPAIFPGREGAVQLVWRLSGTRYTIDIADLTKISGRSLSMATRERTSESWNSITELANGLGRFLHVHGA